MDYRSLKEHTFKILFIFGKFPPFKGVVALAGLILGGVIAFQLLYLGRIYPNIYVAGIEVQGKTPKQVESLVASKIHRPEKIILTWEGQAFEIGTKGLELEYDFTTTANLAADVGRDQNFLSGIKERWHLLKTPANIPLVFKVNTTFLEEALATISAQLTVPAIEPSVSIQAGKVVVYKGKDGREVDTRLLKVEINKQLSFPKEENQIKVAVPLREVSPQLSNEQAENLRETAEKLLNKRLGLKFEFETFTYTDEQLVGLLGARGDFDKLKITSLAADVAKGVNREPQNAVFVFKDNRVQEFKPAKDGLQVKENELARKIEDALIQLVSSEDKSVLVNIPISSTKPAVTTEEVNDLGIKELLGRGVSRFAGSGASRVHNIGLSSSRISGVLVPPGETFSFAKVIGDISVYTGYQQAFIIKDGKTVLGDGGGVCQVSTTLFRAALDAGLPITERHPHSYRVRYYEQGAKAGVDASVYVPSVDLKFKNDTPGHLLVQSVFNPASATLVFEIYGTDDGREVSISTPRVWGITPAPPPQYQDDPTLPAGTVKQIDFAAAGAKAAFDYKVVRNGETLQDRTFYTNYRPWQAKYLRGVGPAQ